MITMEHLTKITHMFYNEVINLNTCTLSIHTSNFMKNLRHTYSKAIKPIHFHMSLKCSVIQVKYIQPHKCNFTAFSN